MKAQKTVLPEAGWIFEVGHPDLAEETLRRIRLKCASRLPLDSGEQKYLARALTIILEEYEEKKGSKSIIRADRALSLVADQGKQKETWLPRNIRIYNRVEELKREEERKGRKPKLVAICQQVSEEANRGKFDHPYWKKKLSAREILRRRNAHPAEAKPQAAGTLSGSAIEKIHKSIHSIIGKEHSAER